MLSQINSSYEVQILRQVRVLQTAGILSLPQLCLGLLKWKADSNHNMMISYDPINNQDEKQNKDNHIRLVFDVKYVINDKNTPCQSQLAKQYIHSMESFVDKLYVTKNILDDQKYKNRLLKVSPKNIMQGINQSQEIPNTKYKFINQVIQVFRNLVKKKSEANQKLKQFYEQNAQYYSQSLTFAYHRKDIYDYHNHILSKNNNDLKYYMFLVNQYIDRTHDSIIQSTVFAFQPNINKISFIINPLVLVLLTNIWSQVKYEQNKKNIQNKDNTVFKHTSVNSNFFQKILYIDFSGDQCPYTIDILRSLHKYVMYVSFPKNFNNYEDDIENEMSIAMSQQNNNGYGFERKYNNEIQKMVDNFRQKTKTQFHQQQAKVRAKILLNKQQDKKKKIHKEYMENLFEKGGNKENNNNIYIYPIRSSSLIVENQKIEQSYFEAMYYESNYVYSVIKTIVFKNAQAFNPSMVLINFNGNIHIQNHHFLDIMKNLAVLTDSRMMFFPCMNKIFFNPTKNINEQNNDFEYAQNFLFESYKVYEQHYLNVKKNVDLFQKIQIFHTVASGKTNLSPISNYEPQLQKYRNILIKPYLAHITDVNSNSNDNIKSSSINPRQTLMLASTLLSQNKYCQYQSFFPENCFINRLFQKIDNILTSQIEQQLADEIKQQKDYFKSKYVQNSQETLKYKQYQKALKTFKNQLYVQSFVKKVRKAVYIKTTWKQYDTNSKYDNVLPVTFFVKQNDHEVDIHLTNQSQILYYNKINQFQNNQYAVVFIMNHLYQKNEWKNYYGLVKCVSHQSNTELKLQRVELHEFKLKNQDENEFILYSRWNYHETNKCSLLYWPIKFNFVKQGLAHLNKRIYYGCQTLCNKIYLSFKTNPSCFYELKYRQQCSPQTRCNAFSYQNNDNLQIFIFGGQSFDSTNYFANKSRIVKCNINISQIKEQTKQIQIQCKQYQKDLDRFIPFMSEIDIIKKGNNRSNSQIYFVGGYGTQFGSIFQPLSGYFYRFLQDKIQKKQEVPITRFDILQNVQKKKKQGVLYKQQFHYRPINIRQPLRLRQNISSNCIISKYLNKYILSQNQITCQQTGYMIRNYMHYIVNKKQENKTIINSYEQYSFVDPSYYQYSKQYENFLSHFQQTAINKYMTDIKVNSLDNFMLTQQRHQKTYNQYDFIFLPSTQLILRRRQKNQKVKDNQHDLIDKVISIATNNDQAVILFKHQRITQNQFVIAISDLTHYSLHKQKRQVKFEQVTRFVEKNNQSKIFIEYTVNILKNNLVILTKAYETYLEIESLMLNSNKKQFIPVQSFPPLNNRNLKFKIATFTVNNSILYLLYNVKDSIVNLQIFLSEFQDGNKFISIHQNNVQLKQQSNKNKKLQIIFAQIRKLFLSNKTIYTILCKIGDEKIDFEFQQSK